MLAPAPATEPTLPLSQLARVTTMGLEETLIVRPVRRAQGSGQSRAADMVYLLGETRVMQGERKARIVVRQLTSTP